MGTVKGPETEEGQGVITVRSIDGICWCRTTSQRILCRSSLNELNRVSEGIGHT